MASLQNVTLVNFIHCLSRAMDLVSRAVVNHHLRVGYFASALATEAGLPEEAQRDLLVAGLLHDAGALSLKNRLDALQFESDGLAHAEAGYRLLRPYPRLQRVAEYVRLHHTPYRELGADGEWVPEGTGILTLADRIDVLIDRGVPVRMQVEDIRRRIKAQAGRMLDPAHVDLFLRYGADSEFWVGAEQPDRQLREMTTPSLQRELLGLDEVLTLSGLFSRIIDFRSRFTSTHSSGVAECATALARMVGFAGEEQKIMRVAGNLHDLGKLAVPAEILDKPGPLDTKEWRIMRDHAYYTQQVLSDLPGLESIAKWAGEHHERLDGQGYPHGMGKWELSMGSRIVAVADVFTAVTEDRPYRSGMNRNGVLAVLEELSGVALDQEVVQLLRDHYEEINALRRTAQEKAAHAFAVFDASEDA